MASELAVQSTPRVMVQHKLSAMPRPMAQPRGVAHELMAMAEPAPRAVAQPMPRSTKPVPRPMVQPRAISRKHMSMAHVSRAMAHEPRLMAYKLTAMP